MANSGQAFGARPIGTDSGAPYSGKLRKYSIPTSEGTAVFPGDPIIINGTSNQDAAGEYIPQAVLATAAGTNYITGFVGSVVPLKADDPVYVAASVGGYVLVEDDATTLFEIMGSGSGAAGDVGNTASLVAGAGSTALGTSGWMLDTTTIGTGTQVVIEGIRSQDNNDLSSANPIYIVRINLDQKRNTTGV